MIFVTLGSQKFQFNRLLKKIDDLISDGTISEEVFAQIGYSDYKPKHYAYKEFLDRDSFSAAVENADLIITHGGTGAIMGAVKRGRKVIALPRLACFGEHVDDHQLQIIDEFDKMGIIVACYDVDQLPASYKAAQTADLKIYHSSTDAIIESIDDYLNMP